jgi:putative acetyltransferase
MPDLSEEDMDRLMEIWETAVLATHDFLREGAVDFYRPLVRGEYLPSLKVTVARDKEGVIQGFIGLDDVACENLPEELQAMNPAAPVGKIEMLFVHPAVHGQGVGRRLVQFAESCYAEVLVDVNEQNTGAVGFYEHCGFERFARSALDGQGNPYPLLHMRLARAA